MFSSYVLYDTVAIEAVYFPHTFTAASTNGANSSNAVPANRSDSANNHGSHSHDDEPYELTLRDILLHRLTERYVGRVIPSRGLCVAITEVMEYSASSVRGAAASAWLTATFGVCVFAPIPGTRMKARIAHQNASGVYLTLDFCVSIPFLVPTSMLVPGSQYHAAQGLWYLPLDSSAEGGSGDTAEEKDVLCLPASNAHLRENGDVSSHTQSSTGMLEKVSLAAAGKAAGAMAPPSVPHNKYVVGAEVIVKVVSCTVSSEESVVAAEEAESSSGVGLGGGGNAFLSSPMLPSAGAGSEFGGALHEGPLPIMEIRGSFMGDALGPVAWFEDA
ncbi:putative DNA-directed RNA polymerase III subunit [Leptomonas seymouri]|uniref:Putative DNA-directed RNA polymerase III subunit n=1 Tax=Leptomonas seymouri TaxID=5684 RepID=A0A0N0P336_LEPSE|nr:putative DNA-directed RNA polymerase III subunit [Leptomonas seymouri]|eukprot:KPI83676.1 putative DNA-directed RNA polymerase III subunit [Leptomonas seymouri]